MGYLNRINAIPLSSFNSAAIGANYQSLNGAGTEEACSILRIYNDSTQDVTISYNGVTDHDVITAGDTLQINFQSTIVPGANPPLLAKGTIISGKGTAGVGTIYIAGYFSPSS